MILLKEFSDSTPLTQDTGFIDKMNWNDLNEEAQQFDVNRYNMNTY